MKMEPDLLRTLSDPGTHPDREPLALGHLRGKYLLLEPRRGGGGGEGPLPSPELVLLARESPAAGNAALILPGAGDKAPIALERVLSGMKLAEMGHHRQALFPDGPALEYLYGVDEPLAEPEPGDDDGPISDGNSDSGVGDNPDSPGESLDLKLGPVLDAVALELLQQRAELGQGESSFGPVESPVPQGLQLVVAGSPEELSPGEIFSRTQALELQQSAESGPGSLGRVESPVPRDLQLVVAGSPEELSPGEIFSRTQALELQQTAESGPGSLGRVESPVLRDLQLVVAGSLEELSPGETFSRTQETLQEERDLLLETAPSPKEGSLDEGFLLSPPWTKEVDGCESQLCPGSPLLKPLDLAIIPQIGSGVDLFPAVHSSGNLGPQLEFGQAEHMEDECPSSPEEAPRLRAVFDALDRDGDGFVRIEEFVQFATVYGAEQVKDLTKFLDPAGLGVISFEDFYRGISAIRSGGDPDSQLCAMGYTHDEPPSACPDEFDDFVAFEANEVTDSAYMGSESTYSECETFTDEDTSTLVHQEMHDEVETDSAIDSAVPSEFTDPIEEAENGPHPHDLPLTSDVNGHSIVTVISGEEHFEDYGEGNEADLFSDSLCNGESGFSSSSFLSPRDRLAGPITRRETARYRQYICIDTKAGTVGGLCECTDDHSKNYGYSVNPLAAKLHSIITDEAFEFYCTQCHKQINRLEDLSARLNDLEMNSPNKRLSSKKVARHLHQTGSLTVDAMEEVFQNNSECLEEDIAEKVIFLEKRVTELEKDTAANGEQHSRLKQENLQLVHRANALEEQLKEQELKSDEVLMEEIRRQRELLSKMEREKSIEIENLQARLQQLDDENGELRSCVPCLKANIERLEEEKRKLLDEIEDLTVQLNEEQENKRKLGDKLNHEKHQFHKEKESTQELIEDLRKQLEHLQLFKLEAEQRRGRSSSTGLQEYNSRTRESELEQEIRRLKQDNRNLKEQNDELNGQIINLSIQGAKNLFSASFSESLAAEISSVSRDELMEAIHKQEEINFRLQDYIDRIIVAIMETNPSILEVK